MHTINIKPLSVNQAWQGKRFKTNLYKQYEHDVLLLLPKIKIVQPPYRLNIVVGFSNKASDIDNVLKPFLDIYVCKGITEESIINNLKNFVLAQSEIFRLLKLNFIVLYIIVLNFSI
jgi:hypothetical protein